MDGVMSEEMINTLVLFLVAQAARTPLHASAIMLGDTAIVLAGRSGSGKSSLALAADRAGPSRAIRRYDHMCGPS